MEAIHNRHEPGAKVSYIEIDEALCNGCVLCMKACPTKAIRIRDQRVARIEDVCINCGECVRVCPRSAARSVILDSYDLEGKHTVVSASSALHAQFGEEIMPNEILLGLKQMGFGYVYDQTYTNEIFSVALDLFIEERRGRKDVVWPLISPVCPVVVRLIDYRFPSLLRHIPPLITPREIVAREAKSRLSAKWGVSAEQIEVFHITPCAAKMLSIREPVLQDHSYMNGAIGISSIYKDLKHSIRELKEDKVLHHSGGIGLGWARSGGEIAGMEAKCLAVSGLQETIRYLEKIEMGLLHDVEYVEFRVCTEGCLGGPLNVADKYLAKQHLQHLVRMFGVERRIKRGYVRNLYEQGFFWTDRKDGILRPRTPQRDIGEAIERLNQVEAVLAGLPRKECGACGSPDCQTFAEDVVDGRATLKACRFREGHKR